MRCLAVSVIAEWTHHSVALELVKKRDSVCETDIGKVSHPPKINGRVARALPMLIRPA